MKNKIYKLFAALLSALLLTACGEDPELSQFKNSIDEFCTGISEIDDSINSIDALSDDAVSKLLADLDELNGLFQTFSQLDFPEEFDYLEDLADESSEYMAEAVKSYHEAYDGTYDENMAEYARQNYSRAYKRIQIIISFLHGDEPVDEDLQIEYGTE